MDTIPPITDFNITELNLPPFFHARYDKYGQLSPIQEKSVRSGILQGKTMLVCAPTASGKTLVGTMALVNILGKGKGVYVVPLKALASEKFREFRDLCLGTPWRVAISTGDVEGSDSNEGYLGRADILILTSEKMDSLLRDRHEWLSQVKVVVIDEIHLLQDQSRGPTLEVVITLLKMLFAPQIVGLSATIGNPSELASWLGGELVTDSWRPVKLKQGIYSEGKLDFFEPK